jgi:hypothetical protein
MQSPIRQAPISLTERPLTPERLLAAAVLGQAVADAQNMHQSERCRTSATAFLLGRDGMLSLWSSIAGLPLELVRQQARKCLRRRRRAHHPHRSRTRELLHQSDAASTAPTF